MYVGGGVAERGFEKGGADVCAGEGEFVQVRGGGGRGGEA